MTYSVSISSLLFDLNGHLILKIDEQKSRINSLSRRITRTATLDGGAAIVDNGYSPSDSTFEIIPAILIKNNIDILNWLVKYHSQIIMDTEFGSFLGAIKSVDVKPNLKITFLIKEQLDEV